MVLVHNPVGGVGAGAGVLGRGGADAEHPRDHTEAPLPLRNTQRSRGTGQEDSGGRLPTAPLPRSEHVAASVRRGAGRVVPETAPRLQRPLGPLHPRDGPHIPGH